MATEEYEYNETGSIASKTVSSYNGDITNETVRYSTEYGYGYTANGNVQYTTVYSSGSDAECGQFSTYRYDLSNRITKIQTTKESGTNITIREENYSYNLNDALTAKQISFLQGISDDEETYTQRNYFTDYSYDNSGALVREEHGVKQNNTNIPKNRISYSYNSSGNRIKCQNTDFENSSNSRVTDYTYDSANRLTSKSETSVNSTSNSVYTYDLSGNLLTGTTTEISGNSQTTHSSTYSYDSLNRTSSVTKDGVTSDYTYDENNRRISKSVGTGTTLYYWNNDQMLCEFNSDNVSQCNYYVWGIGNEAEGMMKNGVPYSNTLNLTGDIVCTIGQTNQTEIETQYDAYGNILGGSTLTSFGYTGEYMDAETGLYYLSARFYDPELGRFTQEDDWLTEGPNLYIYCKNNPVLFSDPSGHCNAVDLVYYRRKGDIATLEKLKRLIANGDCDPRYHYDPDENTNIFSINNYTWAIYVTDYSSYGLPIVGHARLYIEDNYGKWWLTEFTGTGKSDAKVYCYTVDFDEILNDLNKKVIALKLGSINMKLTGTEFCVFKGDFSQSLIEAKKYKKEQNYPNYRFFTNNCLAYIQTILSYAKSDEYSIQWLFDHPSTIVPTVFNKQIIAMRFLEQFVQIYNIL